MSGYIPTDDEVETAFMSFVSDLETDFPGSYDEAPEFASIHEAAKGFHRWKIQVQADAWDEGADALEHHQMHVSGGWPTNPYRKEQG